MKPYKEIKLIECPDIGDIKEEGRASRIGRLSPGEVQTRYPKGIIYDKKGNFKGIKKIVRNTRGYNKATSKAKTRRHLKRVNRAKLSKFDEKSKSASPESEL